MPLSYEHFAQCVKEYFFDESMANMHRYLARSFLSKGLFKFVKILSYEARNITKNGFLWV